MKRIPKLVRLKGDRIFTSLQENVDRVFRSIDDKLNDLFNGPHLLLSGTVGKPAYSFADSTNTGMYFSGTDINPNLLFSVSGSNVLSLDLSGNLSNINSIQFDITPTHVHQEGAVHWDEDDHTLHVDTEVNGVALQVGQEIFLRATNKTGSTITNGQVVYIDGAQGQRPTVALADADLEATSTTTIGIATHDISNNNTGYITTFGLVRDVDTSSWSDGDSLYLSTTAGALSNSKAAADKFCVRVGVVAYSHATEGIIFVEIQTGRTLLAGTSGGQTLYGGTDSGDDLTLASTSNATKGSIFFGANSAYDEVNDRLGIGTTTPAYPLEINGAGTTDLNIHSTTSGGTSRLYVGAGGTGNRANILDFVGDSTYTTYGTRLIRDSGGANAITQLAHRGTGDLQILANEAADITFWTDSTRRMVIDSDGDVGIGLTNPVYNLDVQGTNGAIARFVSTATNSPPDVLIVDYDNSSARAALQVQGNNGATECLFVASSGKTGIGTASPTTLFDVYSTEALGLTADDSVSLSRWRGNANTNNHYFYIKQRRVSTVGSGWSDSALRLESNIDNNASAQCYIELRHITGTPGNNAIAFGELASDSDWMVIDNGNVGIGTTSPGAKLHLSGTSNTDITIQGGTNGIPHIDIQNDARTWQLRNDGADGDRFKIYDSTAGITRLAIDSSGYVGIGTAGPAYKLQVDEDRASNYCARFFNDGGLSNRYGIIIQCGQDTPSDSVSAYFIRFNEGDGTTTGFIQADSGGVVTLNSSDERIKTDIGPTEISGLDTINQINIIKFKKVKDIRPDKENRKRFLNDIPAQNRFVYPEVKAGFSAQNLQSIFPDAVNPDPDGVLGVADTKLIPILIKAVQEQQEIINNLINRIEVLEGN